MSPLSFILSSSPAISSHFLRPFAIPKIQSARNLSGKSPNQITHNPTRRRGRRELWRVRSELSGDAPFAMAIGACMLNSLIFPYKFAKEQEEDDDNFDVAIGPADARFAVMAIISFIPYFNWLTWVFAWMDTRKLRYAVYAAVYLAPYIRTNLSLSPEESWLPIASIVLCIIHVQLEASIKDGDVDGFTLFKEAANLLGLSFGNKDEHNRRQRIHKVRRPKNMDLPSGESESEDEI